MTAHQINDLIQEHGVDTNQLSDGFHTIGELYEHRIVLYITLLKFVCEFLPEGIVWRSKKHSDGSAWDGWFIMGVCHKPGSQITYHLPESYWDETHFALEIHNAPDWDGHTPADVLDRLKKLYRQLK